jgi:hypothetical protein
MPGGVASLTDIARRLAPSCARAEPRQRAAARPAAGWTRRRAGATGPRRDDWRWRPVAEPLAPDWRCGLLGRRRVSRPQALQASVVFAPQATPLAAVVRVAGTRWTLAQLRDAAKGDVGLAQYEVRSWTGWYRPMTRALWAHARLTGLRPGAIAVEAFKKRLPSPQEASRVAVCKASRGLTSRRPVGRQAERARNASARPVGRQVRWRVVLGGPQTLPHLPACRPTG